MKKFFSMLTVLLGLSSLVFAQYGSSKNQSSSPYGQSNGTQGQYYQGQQQQGSTSDCDHLSQQEQQFAKQLSTIHRTMFCRHFSVSQRIEAMTLSSSEVQGLQGQQSSISPDEAVEIVMKNARAPNGANESQQQQNPYGQQQNKSDYSYPSGSSSSKPYSNY
jgi:hypothetical protein